MDTCSVCHGSGYIADGDEVTYCDAEDCSHWAPREDDRERIRRLIVSGQRVAIDAVPLELFEDQHPGECRKWFGGRRNPRHGMPDPPYTVLTQEQIVAFLSRLSPAELDRLRVRLGMTGKAA